MLSREMMVMTIPPYGAVCNTNFRTYRRFPMNYNKGISRVNIVEMLLSFAK